MRSKISKDKKHHFNTFVSKFSQGGVGSDYEFRRDKDGGEANRVLDHHLTALHDCRRLGGEEKGLCFGESDKGRHG